MLCRRIQQLSSFIQRESSWSMKPRRSCNDLCWRANHKWIHTSPFIILGDENVFPASHEPGRNSRVSHFHHPVHEPNIRMWSPLPCCWLRSPLSHLDNAFLTCHRHHTEKPLQKKKKVEWTSLTHRTALLCVPKPRILTDPSRARCGFGFHVA